MKEVGVRLDRPAVDYTIRCGSGVTGHMGGELSARPYALITDETVRELHGERMLKELTEHGHKVDLLSFPAGEAYKNMDTCMQLASTMQQAGYGRDAAVLALGGGVVGDVAGFVASIYVRGIPVVQVPTTVMAQTDSSIGGKTGVNTEDGKNLLGTFWHPEAVYADTQLLDTLPRPIFSEGLAETIKHGVIEAAFFDYLDEHMELIMRRDQGALEHMAYENCRIKADVVQADPYETGFRRVLNYGHTVAHGIESAFEYEIPHGEAVAMGMLAEGRVSERRGMLASSDVARIEQLLQRAGLPTELPAELEPDRVYEAMLRDKKNTQGSIRCALPRAIGEMELADGAYAVSCGSKELYDVLSG